MEHSSSFTALVRMLEQGWFRLQPLELQTLLDKLEKTNVITPGERQMLFERAKQLAAENQARENPKESDQDATDRD